jgi:uncharacterized protein (DUF4213/DUF364 family)
MRSSDPWHLYDRLLEAVPPDLVVADCLVGLHWTLVRSVGVGIAMTPPEGERRLSIAGAIRGRPVREIAALAKSWNWVEATVGLAAINSVINAPSTMAQIADLRCCSDGDGSIFERLLPEIRGKRVAVIGHFPNLESTAAVCDLHILERRPQPGDYPDPACEYLLPTMDHVFITGSTLINKTLPRLLALGREAKVVLVGPSTPLTPILLRAGVWMLAGSVVRDEQTVWRHVAEGGERTIFKNGAEMVRIAQARSR